MLRPVHYSWLEIGLGSWPLGAAIVCEQIMEWLRATIIHVITGDWVAIKIRPFCFDLSERIKYHGKGFHWFPYWLSIVPLRAFRLKREKRIRPIRTIHMYNASRHYLYYLFSYVYSENWRSSDNWAKKDTNYISFNVNTTFRLLIHTSSQNRFDGPSISSRWGLRSFEFFKESFELLGLTSKLRASFWPCGYEGGFDDKLPLSSSPVSNQSNFPLVQYSHRWSNTQAHLKSVPVSGVRSFVVQQDSKVKRDAHCYYC